MLRFALTENAEAEIHFYRWASDKLKLWGKKSKCRDEKSEIFAKNAKYLDKMLNFGMNSQNFVRKNIRV